MKIKKLFLMNSFVSVLIIGLLYGISPAWFARQFLNVPEMTVDFAHILRALMCLYIALGVFWLVAAFNDKYRNPAILTTVIFAGGLMVGRVMSVILDGVPSPLLLLYHGIEVMLTPIAIWVYRLPE